MPNFTIQCILTICFGRRCEDFFAFIEKKKHLSFKTGVSSESFWTQNNSSMARYLAKITPLS